MPNSKSATTVESRGVQSVEAGARILSAMVEIGSPAMLRDIAARAATTSAQAHAYLVSFRKTGFVEQDAATGRYLLGPFALQLGLSRMRQVDTLRLAGQTAADLAAEFGLMVTLSVWGTHGPTIVQVQDSEAPIHVNLRAGGVYTLSGTATGRLFAAFLPERVVKPLLSDELRPGGQQRAIGVPTSKEALATSTARIRIDGCSTTAGSPVPGVNAIAVPIFDHTGHMQCALTLIGPEREVSIDPAGPMAQRAIEVGRDLSARLGYVEQRASESMPEETATRPSRRAARAAG
ncbi:IclR family transcriptional regulator [Methylobacterium sp.]|jgi:DNA-binding IclR family transcriptional regulator|uniref:IclR family transcriptional regulator n=1 Tax=Methylobacterium sp. TaxID=409 RepID=UPI0025E79C1B|nr:IclR family transcriptional regulator [Methylobacterium sp.]MBY0257959.1 IclR family transcriptional regulator [Methylobacterium sp.]